MSANRGLSLERRWKSLSLATQVLVLTALVYILLALITRIFANREAAVFDEGQHTADQLQGAELAATRLGLAMVNMETGVRGYLLSGDSAFLEPYQMGRVQVASNIDVLRTVASLDASMWTATVRYDSLLQRWRREAERDVGSRSATLSSTSPDGEARLLQAKLLMDSTRRAHADVLRSIQASAASARAEASQAMDDVRAAAAAYRIGILTIALLLSLIITRDITRTLKGIIRGAMAVVAGKYGDASVTEGVPSSKEVQQLAGVFNQLAVAVAEREDVLQSDIMQLRELEQLKTDFVATVSHELRTPLTSIRGSLGLVLGGAAGELSLKSKELLRIAFQNTERLVRLINNILDIEKMEAGHVEIMREPCNLMQALENTVRGITPLASEYEVRLQVDGPAALTVMGDADRLVQVFTNLLSNAIKFSPKGGTVSVDVQTAAQVASVRVTDHGPGIPPEFQARIFGKFQQGHRAGARTNAGTGLGLAISKAIVELHGGAIRFESTPGVGTTFIVDFPYVPPAGAAGTEAAGAEPNRILIVEDDLGMQSVLRAMCDSLGEVVGAGSAEDAWERAREARFDAMIIDPGLPGASGFDLIRQLRADIRYEDIPILVFSAREYSGEDLAAAGVSPSHAFIKSRHSEQDLVTRLRAAISARRLTREVRRHAGPF